jgi:hypothetical protein
MLENSFTKRFLSQKKRTELPCIFSIHSSLARAAPQDSCSEHPFSQRFSAENRDFIRGFDKTRSGLPEDFADTLKICWQRGGDPQGLLRLRMGELDFEGMQGLAG